jgi:SEL1 protein
MHVIPCLQVADLSTRPEALPLIERIRLHVQSSQGLQADRQREVVQYYQYSADKGNVRVLSR